MPAPTMQSMLADISARLSTLETKVRLNEQNFFNAQERVQLLGNNFLDLKKELLGRIDNLAQETHEIEKSISELRKKFSGLEGKVAAAPRVNISQSPKLISVAAAPHETEMSSEEATRTLDEILKKLEAH